MDLVLLLLASSKSRIVEQKKFNSRRVERYRNSQLTLGSPVAYALLKSDVTRRDHVSVVMDAGSRIVNIIVNFIRDGTVFA